MAETLLALDQLSVRFGGITALSQVSFDVAEASFVGIIGPNGAGKTTLFHVMSGVVRPSAGHFRFAGRDLAGASAHIFNRAGIARTFQTARVFRDLSVRENVCFGLRFPWRRGGRAADVARETDALLDRLGLAAEAAAPAGSLPPTRQRLLEIGMALATNPRLLLMDEVAAGLTQSETEATIALVQAIRRERGLTVIWIEHNVATLMREVDRVVVLHHGELLADDAPAAVAQDPRVIDAYLGAAEGE